MRNEIFSLSLWLLTAEIIFKNSESQVTLQQLNEPRYNIYIDLVTALREEEFRNCTPNFFHDSTTLPTEFSKWLASVSGQMQAITLWHTGTKAYRFDGSFTRNNSRRGVSFCEFYVFLTDNFKKCTKDFETKMAWVDMRLPNEPVLVLTKGEDAPDFEEFSDDIKGIPKLAAVTVLDPSTLSLQHQTYQYPLNREDLRSILDEERTFQGDQFNVSEVFPSIPHNFSNADLCYTSTSLQSYFWSRGWKKFEGLDPVNETAKYLMQGLASRSIIQDLSGFTGVDKPEYCFHIPLFNTEIRYKENRWFLSSSSAYLQHPYTFFSKHIRPSFQWYQIVLIFPPLMWGLLVISFAASTECIKWLTYFNSKKGFEGRFTILRMTLEQGLSSEPKYFGGMYFFAFLWFIAIVISNSYKGFLLKTVVNPPEVFVPKNMKELLSSDFTYGASSATELFVEDFNDEHEIGLDDGHESEPLSILILKRKTKPPWHWKFVAHKKNHTHILIIENIEIEMWEHEFGAKAIVSDEPLFDIQAFVGIPQLIPWYSRVNRIAAQLSTTGLPPYWNERAKELVSKAWQLRKIKCKCNTHILSEDVINMYCKPVDGDGNIVIDLTLKNSSADEDLCDEGYETKLEIQMLQFPFFFLVTGIIVAFVVFLNEGFHHIVSNRVNRRGEEIVDKIKTRKHFRI